MKKPKFINFEVPDFKNNKELFINEFEKRINHMINPPPKVISILSNPKKSSEKTKRNLEKNNLPFSLNQKKEENKEFLYYDTQNYKNYKYKLIDIDLEVIQRKKVNKRKITKDDYNWPRGFLSDLEKEKKHRKLMKIIEIQKQNKRIESSPIRSDFMKKIMNLSIESIKIRNKPNSQPPLKLPKIKNTITINSVSPLKNNYSAQNEKNLLFDRLQNIVDNNNNTIIKKSKKFKDKSQFPLITRKIGGGFKLKERFKPIEQKNIREDQLIENHFKIEENNKKIHETLKKKKKTIKIKDNLSTDKILSEFLQINKENDITLTQLKSKYSIFKNNEIAISDRILLALEINPYDSVALISWEAFYNLKKILINKNCSINDYVNFVCRFFNPNSKNQHINITEFLTILKSLTTKLGSSAKFLFDLYIDNMKKLDLLKQNMDYFLLDDLRQSFLNRELRVLDILDLIIESFN